MTLQRLALVLLTVTSLPALAMQTMTDANLSDTTGQDGLTVTLGLPTNGITAQMILHDTDGLAPNGTMGSAGAILMGDGTATNNFKISGGTITLDIDADGGTGTTSTTAPVLNIKIGLPSNLTVSTGTIAVAKSGGLGAAYTNASTILDNTTLSLGGLTATMQLGAEAQGSMLKLGGAVTGGITLSNFFLKDNWNGTTAQTNVGLGANSITIKDNGGTDLTMGNIAGDVTAANGLQFTLTSIGSAGGIDVQMTGVKLGDTTATGKAIGNVELRGLVMNGAVIGIKGH